LSGPVAGQKLALGRPHAHECHAVAKLHVSSLFECE